jgi:hypothetical protein
MQGFSHFLLEAQGMGVPFLYPLGYQGVGQYPPEYLAALFPDALIYIAADERLQKCWEAEPFKIDHLKPQPIFNKAYGKLSLVSTHPKIPEGKVVPWKSLSPDPDQKLYPAGPAHPCMVSEPKCLPPHLVDKEAEKFGDPCHGKWKLPEHKMKKFDDYLKNEYAPLVGALPGQVPITGYRPDTGVVAQEPLIPDEFPQKRIVTDKKSKLKKPKINEGEKMPLSFLQLAEMIAKKKDLVPSDNLPKPMQKPDQDYRAWDEDKVLFDKKKQKARNKFE